jgi:hypothetical protein
MLLSIILGLVLIIVCWAAYVALWSLLGGA